LKETNTVAVNLFKKTIVTKENVAVYNKHEFDPRCFNLQTTNGSSQELQQFAYTIKNIAIKIFF
jgi:hypothetical protein